MKVIKFAPGLIPVLKHQEHDQSAHGNWAGENVSFKQDRNLLTMQDKNGKTLASVKYQDLGFKKLDINSIDSFDEGKGYATKILENLYSSFPEHTIFWGKTIIPASTHLAEKFAAKYGRTTYIPWGVGVINGKEYGKLYGQDEPVLKHGTHDQKDHGNWATGSQGSVSELSDSDIQDILHNTKTIEEMYQKVAERLGKTLKPKVAVIPEGEENLYRGLSNLERDSQQLVDGKIPFTPFQTWGQGIYATPSKQDAESYGQVVRMRLDSKAKIITGEPEPFSVDTTSTPFKSDFIDFPRLLPKITSGEIDNFSISDAYNIYHAAKGYDGYQPHGGEIVLFNGTYLTVNKADIGEAVKKHQEHDQSSHGNWATGELSGEQKTVISAWTSLSDKSSWRQIANDLSEGKTPNASESDTKTVKTLVDAIKQNGVIPAEALGRAELLTTGLRWQGAVPKVGDTLKNELSSATLDERTSERFSQYSDFGGSKGKPVIFHYGFQTKGLDVNRAGADTFADEQEWLVSGTFKITDRYSENGITHLNLKPVEAVKKHQQGLHDQRTHGSWAGGGGAGVDITEALDEVFFKEKLNIINSSLTANTPNLAIEAAVQAAGNNVETLDLIENMDFEESNAGRAYGDNALKIIAERQGFTDKPKTVETLEDLENLQKLPAEQGGGFIVFRGVADYSSTGDNEVTYTAEQALTDFREGEYFAGWGAFGNGTYTTPKIDSAQSYADDVDSDNNKLGNGKVMAMMIPDTAKSPTAEVVKTVMKEMVWGGEKSHRNNVGRRLAAMGYQYYDAGYVQSDKAGIFVVLDRSMLTVAEQAVGG
jgi:hypothetical protein